MMRYAVRGKCSDSFARESRAIATVKQRAFSRTIADLARRIRVVSTTIAWFQRILFAAIVLRRHRSQMVAVLLFVSHFEAASLAIQTAIGQCIHRIWHFLVINRTGHVFLAQRNIYILGLIYTLQAPSWCRKAGEEQLGQLEENEGCLAGIVGREVGQHDNRGISRGQISHKAIVAKDGSGMAKKAA